MINEYILLFYVYLIVAERCGRESHHPAEGALGAPDGVWGPD